MLADFITDFLGHQIGLGHNALERLVRFSPIPSTLDLAAIRDRYNDLDRSVLDPSLAWQMATRGVPGHIRSDNGPEFTTTAVRNWLGKAGVKTLFIEPGSPWENRYVESLNGKLRGELLDREVFETLLEARVMIERWRGHYNTVRPHSSLGYRP